MYVCIKNTTNEKFQLLFKTEELWREERRGSKEGMTLNLIKMLVGGEAKE